MTEVSQYVIPGLILLIMFLNVVSILRLIKYFRDERNKIIVNIILILLVPIFWSILVILMTRKPKKNQNLTAATDIWTQAIRAGQDTIRTRIGKAINDLIYKLYMLCYLDGMSNLAIVCMLLPDADYTTPEGTQPKNAKLWLWKTPDMNYIKTQCSPLNSK